MVITRKGFSQVVGNAYAGFGFPVEGPTVHEFPMEMFMPASDLTPIKENIDKVVYGLTKWQPKIVTKGAFTPPMITVQGKDYPAAVDNMNNLFLKNMWSDGLPLVPPTEERVNWILTGTDLPHDTVISKVDPRGGIANVESIAVSLAMAGGRPEYLPVLVAVVEAITDSNWGLQKANTTTGGPYPAVIVNGSVAKQIRLNSGYGIMGPDPQHPADGSIGRALRLILQNIGGAIPGIGTMAIHGEMRYTNAVFAEDEEGLPEGWNPLSVDRGFARGSNVVTVMPADDIVGIFDTTVNTEATLNLCLSEYSDAINHLGLAPRAKGTSMRGLVDFGMVLIGRGTAAGFARLGWSKEKIRTYLWDKSKPLWEGARISFEPNSILIVVAGGEQAGHGSYIDTGGNSNYKSVSKAVRLPAKAKWDALLNQAKTDLGPIPLVR